MTRPGFFCVSLGIVIAGLAVAASSLSTVVKGGLLVQILFVCDFHLEWGQYAVYVWKLWSLVWETQIELSQKVPELCVRL